MYQVPMTQTTSHSVNLLNRQLPYTYQYRGTTVTIHQVTECSPDGEAVAVLVYQIDGGERVRVELQYHIYIWDIGVQCGFEPETDALEVYANEDITKDTWVTIRQLCISSKSHMYNGSKYHVIAWDLYTILLIKDGDIRNPIVVDSIDDAATYGISWREERAVPMTVNGVTTSGTINQDRQIVLLDGSVHPIEELESVPASYFYGAR